MKATTANIQAIREAIEARKERSAWGKGVQAYALDLLDGFDDWRAFNEANGYDVPKLDQRTALNGAKDWSAWAYGGCGLCYDYAIAERLCTASELKRTRGGERRPNARESWLDVEARAVVQAWCMIVHEAALNLC